MKADRFVIFTTALVVLLAISVPLTVLVTAPTTDSESIPEADYESINIYVYFSGGDPANILPNDQEPLKGSGSNLSSVISSAFDSRDDYEVAMLPTMAIDTVNGRAADEGSAWIIFQWTPPVGWTPVVPGPLGDSTLAENTSYLIALSRFTNASGRIVYETPPVGGPISECVFYLRCNTLQYRIKPAQLGEGEDGEVLLRKLNEGFFIVGYGTSAAYALVDACKRTFGWEDFASDGSRVVLMVPESRTANLTELQKCGLEMGTGEGGTIAGWLGTFMGLCDINLGNGLYEYWIQYSWSETDYRWGYNGWCLGYYDPSVTKYIGMAYGSGAMQVTGDSSCPFRNIDPHDYIAGV